MGRTAGVRILHFYKTYFPESYGGTEQFIYQLALGTAKLGHTVDVLSLARDVTRPEIRVGNHTAFRSRLAFEVASTGFSLSVISRFRELARLADVVHYHFPWPFMDVVHFATQSTTPSVLTYHSDIIRQRGLLAIYRPLMSRFLSSVDRIVATSPNYLATSDVLTLYRHKTTVIPIGLDEATYPQPSAHTRKRWIDRVGSDFFIFVGALRYYKGLHILLDAIADAPFKVVIVGSGPMEAELKQHAARLHLSNVQFLGSVSDEDKVALIELSSAVVFPSHLRSEAFGISLLEGAMFGKPLISSEIGTGTSFTNVDRETGIVVAPSDPAAFRGAMEQLHNNPQERARMGDGARRRYEKLFTGGLMVSRYLKLYKELAAGRSPADVVST